MAGQVLRAAVGLRLDDPADHQSFGRRSTEKHAQEIARHVDRRTRKKNERGKGASIESTVASRLHAEHRERRDQA